MDLPGMCVCVSIVVFESCCVTQWNDACIPHWFSTSQHLSSELLLSRHYDVLTLQFSLIMCRWITLLSSESVSLSDLILAPRHSLIHQSRDATYHPGYGAINNSPMNGDGFGIGWYHTNQAVLNIPSSASGMNMDGSIAIATPSTAVPQEPQLQESSQTMQAALFKDTFPAWNNQNLRELCLATSSPCVMAHVRAASPMTGVSHQNCHPFKAGRLLFCHNGRIFGFPQLKRRMINFVTDEAFRSIRGTTDSECIFALILTFLAKDHIYISPFQQTKPFGANRLVAALKKTLWWLESIQDDTAEHAYSTLNFSITDGETMVVTRFCDRSPEVPPPSLYFAFGDAKSLHKELTQAEAIPLSSEPTTLNPECTTAQSDTDLLRSNNFNRLESNSSDADSSSYREQIVPLEHAESKPGRVLADVNPHTASFLVTSNPLTDAHVWHKMPQNSIMWCSIGTHPELRLLQRRQHRYSVADVEC